MSEALGRTSWSRRRVATAVAVVAGLLAALTIAGGPVAYAVKNPSYYDGYHMKFYAYIKTNGKVFVSTKNSKKVIVKNEAGKTVSLTNGLSPAAAANGVWTIEIQHDLSQEKGPGRGFDYTVEVRHANGSVIPGRVWVNSHEIENGTAGDLIYWGVSDLGYVYKISLHDAQAYTSTVALRSAGAAPDSSCAVANKSVDRHDTERLSAYLDCGDTYRLFFENPDSALPATAKHGSTTLTVKPAVVSETAIKNATKLAFAQNSNGLGGTFTLTSHTAFSGTAEVQIDADNNGRYTDAVDVRRSVAVNGGKGAWSWDGKGATGAYASSGAKAQLVLNQGAEAHLLLHDFESLGGVTMTRLNGDGAPNSQIYWDDTAITKPRNGTKTFTNAIGTKVNSASSQKVHGWAKGALVGSLPNSQSWGDGSVIDNWAFVDMNVTSNAVAIAASNRTLSFNVNGGSSSHGAIARAYGTSWGTLPTPTRAGYTFKGWNTATNGSGTTISAASPATANLTVYAQWAATSYTLTLNPNGGTAVTPSTIVKPYGTAWGTLPTTTRDGYSFAGWNTAVDGSGTAVSASTPAPIGNVTAYAQWKPNRFTLTLNPNGGSAVTPGSIDRTLNTAWGTLPTSSRTGYLFSGWTTKADGTGTVVTSTSTATANLTVWAKWVPVTYNVVFHANPELGKASGATTSMAVTYNCSPCALSPNGFSKTTGAKELVDEAGSETVVLASRFLGWSHNPADRTPQYTDKQADIAGKLSTTHGATVNLYAIWDDAPSFVVTEYPNRYFTLEQAKAGGVTETELLSTVVATDRETNPLARKTAAQVASSGSDVGITLYDYEATDFTSLEADAVVTVTYKVKDAAQHVAFLRIKVTVSTSGPLAAAERTYLRSISPAHVGTLPTSSLWVTDPARAKALEDAMDATKAGTGVRYCLDVDAMGALRGLQVNLDGGQIAGLGDPRGASDVLLNGSCPR